MNPILMNLIVASSTSVLSLTNVIMGAGCITAVLVVAVGVYLDIRDRRRWKAMVPDAWPPTEANQDATRGDAAARATSAEPTAPGSRRP